MRSGLIFCILVISCAGLSAQQQDYQLFTTREGLPHDNVLTLMQDSEGFLWLGTYNGLCLYDGQGFKHYPEVYTQHNGGWTDVITSMIEDTHRNVWIGSWGGYISRFDRFKQKFTTIKTAAGNKSKVCCMYEDFDGKVWAGFYNGSIAYIIDDSLHYITVSGDQIWSIKQVDKAYLHIITQSGLYKYDLHNKVIIKLADYRSKILFNVAGDNNRFYTVDELGYTRIELGTIVNEKSFHKSKVNSRNLVYDKIFVSDNGDINVANGSIIYTYAHNDQALIDSFYISHSITYDKNIIINEGLEDQTGIIWLATTAGLMKVDKHKKQFGSYNITDGSLKNNYVRALMVDTENNLWIGYRSGKIDMMAYDSFRNKHYYKKSFELESSNSILKSRYITNTFLQTRNGKIISGGEQGVFYKASNNKFRKYLPHACRDTVIQVWALYEDKKGNIWIGTKDQGLFIYDQQTKKLHNYRHDTSDEKTISNNSVWKIFADNRGRIWLGTDDGLNYVYSHTDIPKLEFHRFELDHESNCNVWNILQDVDGDIWIGTTAGGLYKISNNLSKVTHLNLFEEQTVSGLILDNNNDLWISTISGLYKYNKTENKLLFFNENDGLISNDFNFNAITKDKSEDIFLGTKVGVVHYNPTRIVPRKVIDDVLKISEVQVSGENHTGSLSKDSALNLTYKKNDIIIELALTDYSQQNKLFRYKLQNYDDTWNYMKINQNRITYTNIPPGNYRLFAEANNGKGDWSYSTSVPITIEPAIWQTLWFRLLSIFTFLTSVALIFRWRIHQRLKTQKEKNDWEKRIAKVELDAIRAQMNPHFLFNTINSIQGYILDGNDIKANEYLTKFARLMRLFLESSKNRFILLNDEIELIELYLSLEKIRFEDKFDYEIIIENIENKNYRIPSLLIQPFLENAIKHGLVHRNSKGQLKLTIKNCTISESNLKVLIDDNGIGRKQSQAINATYRKDHISRGMQMINDRVKTYNFIEERKIEIRIIDKVYPEQGTLVEITVPVSL